MSRGTLARMNGVIRFAVRGRGLTKREAVLAAAFPFVALSLLNDFYRGWLFSFNPGLYWLVDVVQFIVAPAAGWYFFLRPAGITPRDWGMPGHKRPHERRDGAAVMLFVAFLLVAADWPVILLTQRLYWAYADHFQPVQAMPVGFSAKLALAVYMSASAAMVEEAVWRGLGWLYLSAVLPPKRLHLWYVLITSAAFALAHSEQGIGGVIAAFWFGVLAAGLYTKLRILWPIVLGHFIIDMIIFGPW